MTDEIITYLEMTDPAALCGPRRDAPAIDLVRVSPPDGVRLRWLYEQVGGPWHWTDRLDWDAARWQAHAERPGVELWQAVTPADALVGFVELARRAHGEVEIAYFGLLAGWIGRGYGAAVLAAGVDKAWQPEARRVWLHTCNFDHPAALANYQARGFRIYDVERVAAVSER